MMTELMSALERERNRNEGIERQICPVCHGSSAPDAVFCENPACRKALGPFDYAGEVLELRARWHERLAERVVAWVGHSAFFAVHLLWFALWCAINVGTVSGVHPFDVYPFGLLGILLAGEAILLTGFVLISQNRQQVRLGVRMELDYEVCVRTYREVHGISAALRRLEERSDLAASER